MKKTLMVAAAVGLTVPIAAAGNTESTDPWSVVQRALGLSGTPGSTDPPGTEPVERGFRCPTLPGEDLAASTPPVPAQGEEEDEGEARDRASKRWPVSRRP